MGNTSDFSNLHYSLSPFNFTLWILYLIIIVVGIVGNFLVVCIVYRNKNMHTTTNCILSNLAISDSMSLIFCPIPMAVELAHNLLKGFARQLVCRVFAGNFLSQLSISASFTSLVFLATDRYYAMVKPFHTRYVINIENVRCAVGFIWLCSLLCCVPIIVFSKFDELLQRCVNPWTIEKAPFTKVYLTAIAILFGVVFCLLCFCYGQILRGLYITKTVCSARAATSAKKKLASISIMVTLSFCICYAPFLFLHVYLAFKDADTLNKNYQTLYMVNQTTRFILYLSCSLNPILYAFQSSRYRDNLRKILTRKKSSRVGVIYLKDL